MFVIIENIKESIILKNYHKQNNEDYFNSKFYYNAYNKVIILIVILRLLRL